MHFVHILFTENLVKSNLNLFYRLYLLDQYNILEEIITNWVFIPFTCPHDGTFTSVMPATHSGALTADKISPDPYLHTHVHITAIL